MTLRWGAAAALGVATLALGGASAVAAPSTSDVGAAGQPAPSLAAAQPEQVPGWRSVSTAAADSTALDSYPHTCGVRLDGSLWCWGDGNANLGDGKRVRLELAPRQVGSSTDWTSVVSSTRFTCAIDGSADLWCWGTNRRGELGDGTLVARDDPRKVRDVTGWERVDGTYAHACGITGDEKLWCWGANSSGQLGTGTRSDESTPTQVGSNHDWIDVSVGSAARRGSRTHGHSCAVTTEATLWCWGENDAGQLGIGNNENRERPTQVGVDDDWANVSVARHASCATKRDGSLWCWGDNKSGRLGDGTELERLAPVEVAGGTDWSSVDLGNMHTCGIQVDGSGWCWGRNTFGQLGIGATTRRLVPTAVLGGYSWSEVSAAYSTTCGVADDGVGMCWGNGRSGQRGTGNLDDAHVPRTKDPIRGDVGPWDSRWSSVVGGGYLRCGIVADGRGACWSEDQIGELRSGGSYAQPIHDSWTWNELTAGYRFMCGVRSDNALFCGGQPPPEGWTEPLEQVATELSWTSVNGGYSHACALQSDSSLWCWGQNTYGQLGTGDTAVREDPVRLDGSWASVGTGDYSTCGIRIDGSLWCWGQNNYGQLGLGSRSDPVLTPQRVGERVDWSRVSPHSSFSCGTTTGHQALCWGNNYYGQLGDGTTTSRTSPVPVVGAADWQFVTGENGFNHNCGLRLDGSAWCWGYNGGRLGTGDMQDSLVPMPVAGHHVFSDVTVHDHGGCGVDTASLAWCWGQYYGDGTDANHLEPAQLLSVRALRDRE